MAYLGNKNGPRESRIIDTLGHEFFGLSASALADEVADKSFGETRGEVIPVQIDPERGPFIVLSGPKIGVIRFYLLEHGYRLEGELLTKNDAGGTTIAKIDF